MVGKKGSNEDAKKIDESFDKYPEIKEAIEAMKRMTMAAGAKTQHAFDYTPSYFPLK